MSEILATDTTDTAGFTVGANQRIFEVSDGASTILVKQTITTEKHDSLIKWRVRPVVVDMNGAYPEIAGEPVVLPVAEHSFMLGEADGSPQAALAENLRTEAVRAFRHYSQLLAS